MSITRSLSIAVWIVVALPLAMCQAQQHIQPSNQVRQHGVPLHDSPTAAFVSDQDAEWHGEMHETHGHEADLQDIHSHDLHGSHGEEHAGEAHGGNGGTKHCHGVCRDPGHPEKPKHEKPGDVNRGDCPPLRYQMSDCERAGNPYAVHRFAKCSVDGKYSSWFVGGGAAFCRGRCRKPSEGTWGLDYDGLFGHANNWLTYTRHREQGGEGAYETDGEPEFVSRFHGLLGIGH